MQWEQYFFFPVNGEDRTGDVVCGTLLYVCLLFCFGTPRACLYISGIFHWKQPIRHASQ